MVMEMCPDRLKRTFISLRSGLTQDDSVGHDDTQALSWYVVCAIVCAAVCMLVFVWRGKDWPQYTAELLEVSALTDHHMLNCSLRTWLITTHYSDLRNSTDRDIRRGRGEGEALRR